MNLIGLMPVRNEAWVLGLSARVALMWCDDLVILCHACTDASLDIATDVRAQHPGRVFIVSESTPVWHEMQQRQHMLDVARNRGATDIAIVDADEVLTGNLLDGGTTGHCCMKGMLEQCDGILQLPGYNLRGGIDRFHTNGTWGQRWFSTAFKYDPRLHWGLSGRDYDHHHREPYGMQLHGYRPVRQGEGGVMHLWGASERRLRARHAWYKVSEAIKWPEKSHSEIDRMYSLAIHGNPPHEMPQGWQFEKCPGSWWEPYAHLMKYLNLGAEPWQEAEVRRLVNKHGAEHFAGLDLFGVDK